MQQKITPNLWFNENALEAAEYYVSVFPDGKINAVEKYPNSAEEGLADFQLHLAGKPLTVEFEILGMKFVAINAGPEFTLSEAVSFAVECEDQAEIDYYWERLSKVPEAEQCGWCKDQFGLSWQIVPKNMAELMKKPNAFAKMMDMKKIGDSRVLGGYMTGIKTKPGEVEVEHFLETLDAKRQHEADTLIDMMEDLTGEPPVMWGKSIIGFDSYHYKTRSGMEADWPRLAFSPRKGKISLYITLEAEPYLPFIRKLGGKNSIGKGCIYLHKFEEIDQHKLRDLLQRAYTDSLKALPRATSASS